MTAAALTFRHPLDTCKIELIRAACTSSGFTRHRVLALAGCSACPLAIHTRAHRSRYESRTVFLAEAA